VSAISFSLDAFSISFQTSTALSDRAVKKERSEKEKSLQDREHTKRNKPF
jgi:hypothetical protein